MTEYRFNGGTAHYYPGRLHPERDGVLAADPGEIIEFGDQEPPDDGQWVAVGDGDRDDDHSTITESIAGTGDAPEISPEE